MWPSTSPALLTAALKLRTIAADAAGMSGERLASSYGRGFFVVHASKRAVNTLSRTLASDPARNIEDTAALEILVFPIVKRDVDNPNPFVAIGRLPGNDIAINDETVSKFHAFVRETSAGQFLLQDARSRNGTIVDHMPVAARGAGEPTLLRSGQTVRFASVATTFLDVEALLTFAKRFT